MPLMSLNTEGLDTEALCQLREKMIDLTDSPGWKILSDAIRERIKVITPQIEELDPENLKEFNRRATEAVTLRSVLDFVSKAKKDCDKFFADSVLKA